MHYLNNFVPNNSQDALLEYLIYKLEIFNSFKLLLKKNRNDVCISQKIVVIWKRCASLVNLASSRQAMKINDLPYILCPQKMHCFVPRQTQHSYIHIISIARHTAIIRSPIVDKHRPCTTTHAFLNLIT